MAGTRDGFHLNINGALSSNMNLQSSYAKTILDSKLTIVSEQIPSVRSVSIGAWIRTGSRNERIEQNGLSHFIEHMVFKGTANRTAEEIAQSLESVGGHLNAFTGKELTCYYARVLDEHVQLAVDVLADILLNSLFREEDIEKEKYVVFEEIKNLDDTPDELIHDLFSKSLFESHPLAWPILGPTENVRRFIADDVRSYMERQYTTENMIITAAGNIEHDRLVDLFNDRFRYSHFPSNNGGPAFSESSARIDIHPREIAQTHLCIGTRSFPYSQPQRFPLLILNTLLGGGMSSRLFQQIREKEGLAYAVFSFVDFFIDTGIFGAYVGADSSQMKRALSMILREFKCLASKPVSADELKRIKCQLKGNLMLGLESTSNRMIRLAKMEIYLDEYSSLDETLASIDQVTTDEVHAVAKELFDPQKYIITVLGPVREEDVTVDDLTITVHSY
jgi:predicted Zn-dependent peptidase